MKHFLFHWTCLLLFFAEVAFSLEINDQLKVKIVGKHPENIIVLDRGLEDGIVFGDHAKITLPNGFIARLVSLKAEQNRSFWKVYRIVYPEYLTRVYRYDLESLKQSEMPRDLQALLENPRSIIDMDKVVIFNKDYREDHTLTKSDTLKDLSNDEDAAEERKSFVQKITDRKKWNNDTEKFEANIYASPFVLETTGRATQYNYGAEIKNTKAERFDLKGSYQAYGLSASDPTTGAEAKIQRTRANARIEYKGIEKRKRYFTEFDYFTQQQGVLQTLHPQIRIGPLGLIHEFNKGDHIKALEFSYIPMIEMRKSDQVLSDGTITENNKTGLRHSLGMKLHVQKEKFHFEESFQLRPMMNGIGLDTNDMDVLNKATLRYQATEHLSVEYMNMFINDGRQQKLSKLPPTNIIHSLNLRFNFDL